jgi:hypothetical protein
MIQRFERLALPAPQPETAVAIERAMPPAGSTLALPFGEIAGEFRATGRVDKRGRAIYELIIANDTAAPIASFTYALDGRSENRLTWDTIIVPAFSAVAVDIDVASSVRGREPRMIAELYAHEAKLVLDARPSDGIDRGVARRGLALAGAFAGALILAVGYGTLRTQVSALGAPPSVQAGTSFGISYAANGSSADYTVETPDGKQIAAGPLDPHASSFSVALPQASTSLGYDVRVNAHGFLGSDSRTVHVVALSAGTPAAAVVAAHRIEPVRVTKLSLDSDSVQSGEPIGVNYHSNVASGTVRLIDQYGTVRSEAILSARGHSTLVAPYVDADQDLRVVVRAQRNNEFAASAIPVTIHHVDTAAQLAATKAAEVPAVAPVAPAATAAADPENAAVATAPKPKAKSTDVAVDAPAEPVVAVPGPPISVEASQSAGVPVRVHILEHGSSLHLSMMGPDGQEISSVTVTPGMSTVLLQAPSNVSGNGKGYSIVATFSRGVSQETLIRPLVFAHTR